MFLNNEQFTDEQQALLLRRVAELVGSGDCGYLIPRQVTQLTAYHDTSETIFYCMRIMQRAMVISLSRRDKEPVYADHLTHLAAQLQLCAAAVVDIHCLRDDEDVDLILEDISLGRQALEIALNMEATVFISQPIVQRYIKRKWYSHFTLASLKHILPTPRSDARGCRWILDQGLLGRVLLLALLLVQLPLLVPVALYPELEGRLKTSRLYLLNAPIIKFTCSFLSDLAFALALTFIPRWNMLSQEREPLLLEPVILLTLWSASSMVWELRQFFMEGFDPESGEFQLITSFHAYYADRFNRFELPASTLSTVSLCLMWMELWTNGGIAPFTSTTRTLRTIAVLLLWLRVPRIFMLSDRIGPLVLMLFRMWKDVFRYLILQGTFLLAFSAAFLVLFEPRVPTDDWPMSGIPTGARDGPCQDHMVSYLPVVQFLIEQAITGEQFFLCGENDDMATFAWVLAIAFYLTSGILMLNMLIAMMAKTFENISDASATAFQLLVAQNTMSVDEMLPASPPLYILTIPHDLFKLAQWGIKRMGVGGDGNDGDEDVGSSQSFKRSHSASVGLKRRQTLLQRSASVGEHAARVMFQQRYIEEYMFNNFDDIVQTERWRHHLSKMIGGNARQVRQDIKDVRRQMRQLARRLDPGADDEGGGGVGTTQNSGRAMARMGATESARRQVRTLRTMGPATRRTSKESMQLRPDPTSTSRTMGLAMRGTPNDGTQLRPDPKETMPRAGACAPLSPRGEWSLQALQTEFAAAEQRVAILEERLRGKDGGSLNGSGAATRTTYPLPPIPQRTPSRCSIAAAPRAAQSAAHYE